MDLLAIGVGGNVTATKHCFETKEKKKTTQKKWPPLQTFHDFEP